MAKMTYMQIEHARKRLREIRQDVLGASPVSATTFDGDDLYEALLDGGRKIPGNVLVTAAAAAQSNSYSCSDRFIKVLVKAVFAKEIATDKARYEAENAVYMKRDRAFNIKATAVEDAIVLGDCHEALAQLAALSEFTV